MPDVTPFPPLPDGALRTTLASSALLDAHGADAGAFLHGQLSSDVKALAPGQAQWSSYNSPKGRMLATMIVWRRDVDSYSLVLAADLADTIGKRLAMFMMRAKVEIARSTRPLSGVLGRNAAGAVSTSMGSPLAAFDSVQTGRAAALCLPDGRCLLDAEAGELPAPVAGLAAADESVWQWCGIRAGVPQITLATSDRVIAQSANWELLGGVDFRKGCYPGQEIIARMQYLGRLKERLRAYHADAGVVPVAAGAALRAQGHDEAAGMVINAAPSPQGGSDLLAVVRNDAANDADLSVQDIALSPRALPYAVPAIDNLRVKP